MKKIIYVFVSIILLFSISGCYTVAWKPGEELPVKEEVSLNNSGYYNVDDFGVFSYYYNSAWWLNEDYDFLLDNFITVTDLDINEIIIHPFEPIVGPGCPTVPPSIPIPIVSPIGKPNTIPLINNQKKRDNSSNKKIRNNNGSRNNSKGRGR